MISSWLLNHKSTEDLTCRFNWTQWCWCCYLSWTDLCVRWPRSSFSWWQLGAVWVIDPFSSLSPSFSLCSGWVAIWLVYNASLQCRTLLVFDSLQDHNLKLCVPVYRVQQRNEPDMLGTTSLCSDICWTMPITATSTCQMLRCCSTMRSTGWNG